MVAIKVENKFFSQNNKMKENKFSLSKGACNMKQTPRYTQQKLLELIRSLPHPGKVLIDSIGDGISGLSLRPKSIPKKIIGNFHEIPWVIELRVEKEGKPFIDGCPLNLMLHTATWEKWSADKPTFTIRQEDVGSEIGVVTEREKNFNKNLLHEFLDQFSSMRITIEEKDQNRILDPDNYPHFFWDKSISVCGTTHVDKMISISATVVGVDESVIKISNRFSFLKSWNFLTEESRPFMKVLVKWHKALISLYHLMESDNVNIPIKIEEMTRNCWDEINATAPGFQA